MISILTLTLLLSFGKLLVESSLLVILMTMEMASMISFFLIVSANLETLALTSCSISMLTVMISESVLSLCFFINIMRSSGSEMVHSLNLKF